MTEPEVAARDLDPADLDAVIESWRPEERRAAPGPRLVRLSSVKPERVRWLWERRVPLGKLTVLDGDPGELKSTLLLDIGARVTTASPMPDGSKGDLEGAAGIVILSAEDGLADTIRPRLDAAGADCSRVVALDAIEEEKGERMPLVTDLGAIELAIAEVDAAVFVVDPLVAYLGTSVNSWRDQDVRGALAGLARLAEQTGVAVIAVRHLNKSIGGKALYRGGGSIGIIAAARSALLVARDPDEPDGCRRILAPTKSNLSAPPASLAFSPETDDQGRLRIRWEGESTHQAGALLAVPESEAERSALDDARDFLVDAFADGPVATRDLQRQARDAGLAWRTVERAKLALRVRAEREGAGWRWRLPPADGGLGGLGGLDRNARTQAESELSGKAANSAKTTEGGRGHLPVEEFEV